jgi:hypothetical protein
MNDTEQLFLVAAVWALIAAAIARFIPNWPGRIAFFAIAVGLPFWELPYGYYNFRELCRDETDLKISEKFPPQDSVCIEYFDLGLYRQLVEAGFSRIEITGRSDNAKEIAASGRVFLVNREQAKSSYCIAFQPNISLPFRILRSDTLVVHATDNRLIARQSRIRWDGTWWQKAASPIFGIGGVCFRPLSAPIMALRQGAN